MTANLSMVSNIDVSAISLSVVGAASNNLSLEYYQEGSYMMGAIIGYLALLVAGLSLLLFALGYFGSKLQSLEAVAVVQVAALLLMTLENMSPAYENMTNLTYSLGITPITRE